MEARAGRVVEHLICRWQLSGSGGAFGMRFGALTFASMGEGWWRGGDGAHDSSQASRGQWENIWEVVKRIDLRADGVLQNPEEADEEQMPTLPRTTPRADQADPGALVAAGSASSLAMVPYDSNPVLAALSKPMKFFTWDDLPEPSIVDTPSRARLTAGSEAKDAADIAVPDASQEVEDGDAVSPGKPGALHHKQAVPAAKPDQTVPAAKPDAEADDLGLSAEELSALAAATMPPAEPLAHGHNAIKAQAKASIKRLAEEAKAAGAEAAKKAKPKHHTCPHRHQAASSSLFLPTPHNALLYLASSMNIRHHGESNVLAYN